jgi:hypothetical protein
MLLAGEKVLFFQEEDRARMLAFCISSNSTSLIG